MADSPTSSPTEPEQPKNLGGRPLLFETAEQLELAINAYFDNCDPHIEQRVVDGGVNQKGETIWLKRAVMTEQKNYTLSGLARALGVDRSTIKNYGEREGFFRTVDDARRRCEEYWESLLGSPFSSGAKFNLGNNYEDWKDKQVVAGDPDAPLGNPYGALTAEQLRKLAEDDSDGADASDPS